MRTLGPSFALFALPSFALFVLLPSQQALACACKANSASLEAVVAENVAGNDIVAVMEVTGFRRSTERFSSGTEHGRWIVLKPRRVFKGSADELLAPAPRRFFRTDCDVRHGKGDLLLVYARRGEPVGLSRCSLSTGLVSALDAVAILIRRAQEIGNR